MSEQPKIKLSCSQFGWRSRFKLIYAVFFGFTIQFHNIEWTLSNESK